MSGFLLPKLAVCIIAISLVQSQTFYQIQDPRCHGRPDGYFLPNWNDCRSFVTCFRGQSTDGTCPTPFYFDAERQMCNHYEEVNCNLARCPADGFQDFQIAGTCNQFIRCINGHASFMQCNGDMVFDPSIGSCTQPERFPCDLTTICPSFTDPENPVFIPSRENCEKFYFCLDGEQIPGQCDAGVHWNQNKQICDDPIRANCTIAGGLPNDFCPPTGDKILAHPTDCGQFVICSNGESHEVPCGDGLYWNPAVNACDRSENVQCDL